MPISTTVSTPATSLANIADLPGRLTRWQTRLSSPTELQLPTDYPRPMPLKVVEAVDTFELPAASSLSVLQVSLGLQQMQEEKGEKPTASPFSVLLAAFAVLLHRYTAEEDIVVGSSSETLNPLVLRLDVKAENSFVDVLQMVERVSQEAAADEVPFPALMAAMAKGVEDANAAPALFRVRFFNQADTDSETLQKTITAATDLT
ncbi:large subunit of alpha-aminoadipate reductase, partial [Linderina pennispora]